MSKQKRVLVKLECSHNKAVIIHVANEGEVAYCDTCKTTKVIRKRF